MRDLLNKLTEDIIGSAIAVHRELGPGLLESAYEACLDYELNSRGFIVARQVELPVIYRGLQVDAGFRLDLVVNELVVVELKAVERIEKIHEAQLMTYLKLSNLRLGLLLNFNVRVMTEGIKRIVRGSLD